MSEKPSNDHDAADSVMEDLDRLENEGGEAETPSVDQQAELADAKDRALRAAAELENFRKRARREMEEQRQFANQGFARELLPVLDNLGRAIEASEKSSDGKGLLEGCRMVAQQLRTVLSQHDVTTIEALHQPFDPHRHQAVLQQPSTDHPPGTVIMVVQEGFQMGDRIVRPAQVIVAGAPAEAT